MQVQNQIDMQAAIPQQEFMQQPQQILSPPLQPQQSFKLHFGVHRVIGSRNYQEDEYACLDNLTTNGQYAYFAVFDGHGSDYCSAHCSANLHNYLLSSPSFKSGDYMMAIREAIAMEDKALYDTYQKDRGGCTATVCLVIGNQLYLGNLGDSSSIIAFEDQGHLFGQRLSKDHKPDDPEERQRIEEAGGVVMGGRIRGSESAINMSRAMGDFAFKMPQNQSNADWMSSEPHIAQPHTISPNTRFLVLASDGLWNVFKDEGVVAAVDALVRAGFKPNTIAREIASQCGNQIGADNTTVIVVFFDHAGDMFSAGVGKGEADPGRLIVSEHSNPDV
eukprot:TRINITY_DN612_c0_g1_i2.p1 TRINITY_DN612_c0_g1~~TRINITY_DN612_c0_g1_i2.p1  ORF type:complete len:333 (+),score=98.96 TRINITY_DN612_c0_g1_i2:110-1108(+)